ncbi:hypothetical protein M758_1G058100 [Ceratodon purpureus]|nr:hypothetical protein M758_1G058100 [Ceratodon purpureus]
MSRAGWRTRLHIWQRMQICWKGDLHSRSLAHSCARQGFRVPGPSEGRRMHAGGLVGVQGRWDTSIERARAGPERRPGNEGEHMTWAPPCGALCSSGTCL